MTEYFFSVFFVFFSVFSINEHWYNAVKNKNKEEKHRRMKLVKELSDKKHLEFLEKNIGETYFITPEKKPDKKTGLYKAVTPNYIKVLFKEKPKSDYCLIRLETVDRENHTVFGKLL